MKLKEFRVASGLTQLQLAKLLGVKQNTISNWENGKSQMDETTLRKIEERFNLDEGSIENVKVDVPEQATVEIKIYIPSDDNDSKYHSLRPLIAELSDLTDEFIVNLTMMTGYGVGSTKGENVEITEILNNKDMFKLFKTATEKRDKNSD